MATGYVYHEVFSWHDTGTAAGLFNSDSAAGVQPLVHFENAEAKRRMDELVVVSGLIDRLTRLPPRASIEAEVLRVHTEEHLRRIAAESALPKGGMPATGSVRLDRAATRSRCSPPVASSPRSTPSSTRGCRTRMRSSGRRGTKPFPTPGWVSASSTTSRLPPPTRVRCAGSDELPWSTGTYTTAMAPRRSSPRTRRC